MKKPTLRLRQVFEGPTHFKVVKPLGNPIKIAKKGLSPNLMGRLRKFATAGEVPEPTKKDEQNFADLESEVLEQPRRRRPFEADAAPPPVLTEAIDIATRERPRPQRPMTREEIAGLPVDEAVAVDGLDGLTAPVATEEMPFTSRGQIATGEKLVVPARITRPAAMPSQIVFTDPMKPIEPVDATRPRPRRPGAVALVEAVEAAPAAEETTAPAPVQRGQLTGRTKPKRGAVETTAEAEPTEAAAAEKPAPVEPSLFEKALGGLGYTMAQYEAMPAPMKVAAQQAVQATIAAQTAADAEATALDQETAAYAEQEKALKKKADSLAASAKAARETQQKILDEYDYLKNPTNYFASLNPLQQIGTAISLAMGAFASGMTGMPNFAQKIYDNAIEQDLQAQKRKSDSLYQRLVQAGNSVNSAEDLVRAQLKLIGAAEMSRRSAQIKLPQVKAQIKAKAASEALKATSEMQRIAKDQATMAREAELRPFQVRKLKAETAIAEGTPARLKKEMDIRIEENTRKREEAEQRREDRLQAAADRREEDRIAMELDVGENTLQLKSKTRAPQIRGEIAQREQAIMAAMKLDALMRKSGLDIFDPRSDLRGQAIAELATMVEIFPKIQGFQRAISVSAKTQLEKGLQDPTGLGAALKEIFLGRDPAVGVHAILEEGKRSYANQVKKVVRDSRDPVVEKSIQSFFKDAKKEIEKYEAATAADEELLSEE